MTVKEKIGIITFHAAENFGSALQAYALQKVISDYNFDTSIIDFILKQDMQQYQVFRTYLYMKHPKNIIRDIICIPYAVKRKIKFYNFRKQYLNLTPKKYFAGKDSLDQLNTQFDGFICGSDQIWNLNCTGGFIPEFFLNFANEEKKKIAYAPSMPHEISKKYYTKVKTSIEHIDFVSVREEKTVEYLKKCIGIEKNISSVLDPTLLIDKETYISVFNLKKSIEKYIFVYILYDENQEQMNRVIHVALKLSKLKNLKIKYVYMNKIRAFKNQQFILGIGPKEFLDVIYNAEYVITNSFHYTEMFFK